MLPRRSSVSKCALTSILLFGTFLFWFSNPSNEKLTWRGLMSKLNDTELYTEFEKMKNEVNSTFDPVNKTRSQLLEHMIEMKRQMPVNPHKFSYLINNEKVCHGQDVFLVIYVHSAPTHYKRRAFIRDTWGNGGNFANITIKVVFLIGAPPTDIIQQAVYMENDVYHDLIQENFVDSYRNLTYKAIMGLKWVSSHCRHAKYILKTDDDIFVNIYNLVTHLQSLDSRNSAKPWARQNLLLCLVWYHMKVMRDPKSKWYLSPQEFATDYFPTYCSGSAFILTTDVAARMFSASLKTPFFWVDDYYVTGMLAKTVNVPHEKFNSVYSLGPSTFFDKFTEPQKGQTLVFGHVHNLNQALAVWKIISKARGENRNYNGIVIGSPPKKP